VLTPREWDVLRLLARDLTNEQIALDMGISLSGAKYHVSEILSKLDVSTRRDAIEWARHNRERRYVAAVLSWLRPTTALKGLAAAGGFILVGGLMALFALGLHGRQASSAQTPDLGRVAYIQDGDLWVKDLPSGAARQLTHGGMSLHPQMSSDGEWIAFFRADPPVSPAIAGLTMHVIRRDGSGEHALDNSGPVSWSPAGATLAMTLTDGSLVTERADGTGRRVLVPPLAGASDRTRRQNPRWSQDGAWLAFEESRQDQPPSTLIGYEGVRAVRTDGTDEHEVFSNGTPAAGQVILRGWAGDGSLVLWASPVFSASIQADGLPLRVVTTSGVIQPGEAPSVLVNDGLIDASPVDDRVVFTDGGGRMTYARKAIAVLDLTTGAVTTLTDGLSAAMMPSWSPDSTAIAYVQASVSDAGGGDAALTAMAQRRVWLIRPDGSGARLLAPNSEQRQEHPVWSRDGATVVYVCFQGNVPGLCTTPSAGGPSQTIVDRLTVPAAAGTDMYLYGYYGLVPWDDLFDYWGG
jgi:Tol biopolymer transport system component/DNA-binding CsgD family transcriptional regulator